MSYTAALLRRCGVGFGTQLYSILRVLGHIFLPLTAEKLGRPIDVGLGKCSVHPFVHPQYSVRCPLCTGTTSDVLQDIYNQVKDAWHTRFHATLTVQTTVCPCSRTCMHSALASRVIRIHMCRACSKSTFESCITITTEKPQPSCE